MSFDYTTGDPDNLVGGNDASMGDIQGPLYDIRAYLNSGALSELAKGLLVVGEVRFIAVTIAPAGWLACDGAAVSRTTYSKLFTAISTTYGAGDGATTFNVPDLRGRAAVGAGQARGPHASDGTDGAPIEGGTTPNRVIGTRWGSNAVLLGVGEIPSHGHAVGTLAVAQGGDHTHSIFVASGYVLDPGSYQFPYNGGVQNSQSQGIAGGFNTPVGPFAWAGTSGPHTHGASASSSGTHAHSLTGAPANNGGGGTHANEPPSQAIPAYVYAGA